MALLTIRNMHTLIEQDVHRLGFYVYDDLETEEIDLQINKQIYLLVDAILDKSFGRVPKVGPKEGFQASQVTLDNLRKQHVKEAPVTLSDIVGGGGKKFDLPAEYYHFIKASATVTYTCKENGQNVTKTINSKIRMAPTQDIDTMKAHPFHKTDRESPLAELANNTIYIYTDGTFNVTGVSLDYIKRPTKVVFGKDSDGNYDEGTSAHCDLDDSLHYMVQNMASIKIMEILEISQQKIVNTQQETI